jgi:uncharacterized Fe-S cluster-containing radical SAM superfamily protein
MAATIDTASFAAALRDRIIRPSSREVLVSRIAGSDQEQDITAPTNCGGLGRVRHFVRATSSDWPPNSLPIDPACKALGLCRHDRIEAQVFQNAACAWRCWYCYVPFNLLSGDASRGEWVTCDELVARYAKERNPPRIIDLSGGSPDLTPEWIIWMMDALQRIGAESSTYLWSDDNLSTDYVFTKLTRDDRRRMAEYANYGRVCCIKGFDQRSFSFNTTADSDGYHRQFEILRRYMSLRLNLFGYVTLTGDDPKSAAKGVSDLMDRLCAIHSRLPLRFVPLKITNYSATALRGRSEPGRFTLAEEVQSVAIQQWESELRSRFSTSELALNIADVSL